MTRADVLACVHDLRAAAALLEQADSTEEALEVAMTAEQVARRLRS